MKLRTLELTFELWEVFTTCVCSSVSACLALVGCGLVLS